MSAGAESRWVTRTAEAELAHEPPRTIRWVHVADATSPLSLRLSPQLVVHSQTLPTISNRPKPFGAKLPTGDVCSLPIAAPQVRQLALFSPI